MRKGLNRREFLAASAALPALAALRATPAFADQPRHTPPYLGLRKYILPGNDEFPEEKTAAEIAQAFASLNPPLGLPVGSFGNFSSPLPRSYRAIAPDLNEAVFDTAQTSSFGKNWKAWVDSLGKIRRARFFPLPGGVVRYEIASERDGQFLYRVGRWQITWTDGKLTAFAPLEEHVASAAKPLFRDVTAAAFEKTPSFAEQLSRGIPYWRARLDPASGIDIYGSNGVAVGDIDGDGADEIYICQPGGLPNRLYKFTDEGRLTDITEAWGAGILDDTSCALFVDLRNVGRQDLVVLRANGPLLLLNEGDRLRLRDDAFRFATIPAGAFTGMAAADFDRDSKLDLYLCCYVYFQSEAQYTYATPYHDAQNGPPNFLFRNRLNADGSGFFEDCTEETGINENNNRFSFAPAWCDFNDDGWPDLFVANDFGRKNLYVNRNGKFRDLAASAGVEDIGPGMSAAWFDSDHDGKADLYVANMWTDAGQRVIDDKNFAPAKAAPQAYQRHTMGNSLYRNRGDGTFEERTGQEHVNFGRWAWSSGGHDFDNDGNPEIFVTCGMLTNASQTDLNGFFWRQVVARSPVKAQPSAAYENGWNAINQFIREDYSWNGHEPNVLHVRRSDRYYDFSGVSGLDWPEDSRSFSVLDFDGDGRPDIILKSRLGPQVRILQNNCAHANHAIAFELRGTKSNRDAIGARIQVDNQTKWLDAGSGFLSQHSKRILFGLGQQTGAKHVRVTWPSGAIDEFSDLQAGSTYLITEGTAGFKTKAFRAPFQLASRPIEADNTMRLDDTWFLEPVPLPEKRTGPGLFVLTEEELAKSGSRREQYEIFRRYLFDWRTSLVTPFALLLNSDGHAVKVYAKVPSEQQVKADLADVSKKGALPFAGTYVAPAHRDYFKFGAAFLWSGYSEQALPYLEQVLKRSPENARVLVLVGQIHLQANRVDAAEKSFRAALDANANYAEAWSGMGEVCDSRSDFSQALANYEKALALKPDLLYTLLNAGHACDKLNQFQQAEAFYRKASELDAQSPEAANGLGLAMAKQGQTAEAKQYFQRAIELKRDFADAINNLGVLYIQQGQTNDAIAAFEYGIRVCPDEDILYLNLGRTYTRMGNIDRARQVMQQLLERKPENATARRALQDLSGK
ncbi:MAG: VCBS repeat-containing protein [Acidobacteriaceae bacterium]|nr:VCBS repeat-containing protein [Acidobacteriaceae bacterium]